MTLKVNIMLKPVTTNTAATSFEMDDQDIAEMQAAATAETYAETAVAVVEQHLPAAPAKSKFDGVSDAVGALKNAIPVRFNDGLSVKVEQTGFYTRRDNKPLGREIKMELLSWQDNYVISPGDDKAPKDLVKYSDDGKTCSDGTPVVEHLNYLKSLGMTKASLKERTVIVASLEEAPEAPTLVDRVIQIDLSPQSRASFSDYRLVAMNKQRKGRITADQAVMVSARVVRATNGTNAYGVVEFSVA